MPAAPRVDEPARFTQDVLGWKPWLEPLPVAEFTEAHYDALVQRDRVHMPYFRLLARDPEALRERTLTDLDIFFNTDAGLPRAERELAAAAASRFNGCVFCASVHSRFATEQGADRAEVQRLLDEGVGARISTRIDAIVDATVALTATPPRFGQPQISALRDVGLAELELLDAIQAGAFFNWANRLMLSIGEPTTA
nr:MULTISPECIES: alkylhydroperoxidase domain protein [Leucobacter]